MVFFIENRSKIVGNQLVIRADENNYPKCLSE